MNHLTIVVIALGLAMDAFAVSIASGVSLKCFKANLAFRVALFFGGFQAIMPLIGWLAGSTFNNYIQAFAPWVAFGMLAIIGGKMIYESTVIDELESKCDPGNLLILAGLAIATSIDALAVGLSFSMLNVSIIEPAIVIGIITFILSFAGVYLGEKFGSLFENKIEILGGVILILIGTKILLEHFGFINF